jgi:hypothetical protein
MIRIKTGVYNVEENGIKADLFRECAPLKLTIYAVHQEHQILSNDPVNFATHPNKSVPF